MGWSLFVCALSYVAIVVATIFMNNDDRRGELAREMVDTAPPVIELVGGEVMTMAVGDTLVEPGFDVYDDRSVPEVEVTSLVDVRNPGEYQIKYWAGDGNGNVSEASRTVKVVEPAGKIYLTFDDGPSDFTASLLDVLAKYNVKATFFVTGYGDDALIRREFDEGHAVGLHTNSHIYSYIYSSVENYAEDLNAVRDRVQGITGKMPKLIRFPGGSSNMISSYYDGGRRIMSTLVPLVEEWGYKYFDWNVDSDDAGGAGSADQVYANVTNALKWGGDSVVLQHDVKPYSVEAVERIIQYGLENNFVFKKLEPESFAAHHGVSN